MRGLEKKVAIVTGGVGAIGRAICRRFAEEGSVVGVFDINEEAARETAVQIDAAGGSALVQQVDITDYDAVAAATAAFEAAIGPAEILVNNAGWDRLANFLDTDPEFWNRIIAINLLGALNLYHTVVPGPVDTPLLRSMTRDSDPDSGLGKAFQRAIPMRRLGEPDDMPGIVAFLASEDANFITGQVTSVSGDLTMSG